MFQNLHVVFKVTVGIAKRPMSLGIRRSPVVVFVGTAVDAAAVVALLSSRFVTVS